ncbi:unnamed protein product [Rotaria magnacalcarata]
MNDIYDASPSQVLDSALMLILRLVNVQSILESPHSIQNKLQADRSYFIPFNALHYLALTHESEFHTLTRSYSVLCDKPYLVKDHATKIINSILSIFSHILRGQSEIQKKLQEEEKQQSTTDHDLPNACVFVPNNATTFDEDLVQSTTMMRLTHEHADESLSQTNKNLEIVANYCVNHHQAVIPSQAQTTLADKDLEMASTLLLSLDKEIDEAALVNSIAALSTDGNTTSDTNESLSSNLPTNTESNNHSLIQNLDQQKPFSATEPLLKESLDRFTDSIMLRILDILPDTVYKLSELVVTTMHRNGIAWRDHFLEIIANDIKTSNLLLIDLLDKDLLHQNDEQLSLLFLNDHQNSVLFSRTLLMSLLFEEMPFPCARIAEKFSLIKYFCTLIHRTTDYLVKYNEKKTPTWLAPTFIFIDLYEKVSLASKRRSIISQTYRDFNRVWQWFDERVARWNSYPAPQNKQIDDAYTNGEPSCKIVIQRRNYILQFNTMLQTNQDTHKKRPIMLTFSKPTAKTNIDSSIPAQSSSPTAFVGSNTNLDNDDQPSHSRVHGVSITSSSTTGTKKMEFMETQQHDDTTTIKSLKDEYGLLLTSDCVHLIRMPVDPDAIHALLRLILRLTQASAFQGCASLITLIFRHILEDDSNLRLAMEKAIRQALTGNHGISIGVQPACPGSHELNVILCILGPAMTRAPDIFLEVAPNVLQLIPPSTNRLPGSISRFLNPFLNDDDHHAQRNTLMGPLLLHARPATSQTTTDQNSQMHSTRSITSSSTTTTTNDTVGELAERLLVDLLDFLLANEDTNALKRLLSKSTVLRILAELIHSYANVAKFLSTKTFSLQDNQTCSVLSYILEHLLPGTNTQQFEYDKDLPALCRLFLIALAACNHCLESQISFVNEVKMSLNKISVLPECDEKHMRLQAIANIINAIIKSSSASQQEQHRVSQLINNNMITVMYKHGLINDLAKMIHSIELSSSKLVDTVNAVLKPMEILSHAINHATSLHVQNDSHPHATRRAPIKQTIRSDVSTQEDRTVRYDEQQLIATVTHTSRSVEQRQKIYSNAIPTPERNTNGMSRLSTAEDIEDAVERYDFMLLFSKTTFLCTFFASFFDSDMDAAIAWQFDDEVSSKTRNNFISRTDIDPILISNLRVDLVPPPPPMSVPALHPLLVHHADNQLNSGAFSHLCRLNGTTASDQTIINVLTTPENPSSTPSFRQPNTPTATVLTGQTAIARSTLKASDNVPGKATTGILVGSGNDSDAKPFLHDQVLIDVASKTNEGNENIDGTNIYIIQTALARWIEENIVLDGSYVHDTVLALKSKITDPLGKQYEADLQQTLAVKKAKEEEEHKNHSEERARKEADAAQTVASPSTATTSTSTVDQQQNEATTLTAPIVTISFSTEYIQHVNDIVMTSPEQQRSLRVSSAFETVQDVGASLILARTNESSQPEVTASSVTADAGKSSLPTEAMSASGQSSSQSATSPTTSMEINHPSPGKENQVEPQQITIDTASSAETITEQIPSSTTIEQPAVEATATSDNAAAMGAAGSATTTSSSTTAPAATTSPPVEAEVEWTTLVIDGREFRVPKPLEIDPSFLAALPEELRQEILTDQIRNFEHEENLRRAQRAAAYAAVNSTATLTSQLNDGKNNDNSTARANQATSEAVIGEINPQFISLLPSENREKLLADRRPTAVKTAAMNDVNLPDSDLAEFLRRLQSRLRQQVLSNMDENLIGPLPKDMANKGHSLRVPMRTQQQQKYLCERMMRNRHDMMNMLRNTTHHSTRPKHIYDVSTSQEARDNRFVRQLPSQYILRTENNLGALNGNTSRIASCDRQLLDYESICCLLVLLFMNDARLNFPCLKNVVKNLCRHQLTRQWIIKALLSIINKSTGVTECDEPTSTPGAPTLIHKSLTINNNENEIEKITNINPSWLTINFERAFGIRTNVFRIEHCGHTKCYDSMRFSVHAQACPTVCRQVLESLTILAESFPEQFLSLPIINTNNEQQVFVPASEHTTKTDLSDQQLITTPSKASPTVRDLSFWELLLKLDQSFSNRSLANSLPDISSIVVRNSNINTTTDNNQRTKLTSNINDTNTNEIDFESSPLATILFMLDHPILNKNTQLMDKLFTLLSFMSQSFQMYVITKKEVSLSPIPLAAETTTTNSMQQQITDQTLGTNNINNKLVVLDDQVVLGLQLDLVVKTLISKSCTKDGLEYAIVLLLNMSHINQATRDKILHLLVNGIHLLGKNVSEEIRQLHWEVQDYLTKNKSTTATGNDDESVKLFDSKKTIRSANIPAMNIDLNNKQLDLELPAMVMLTSKPSNQQFLLRILKVIMQLHEETKKEQLNAQQHFEAELNALIRRLEILHQSLRSPVSSDNNNQQNEILQSIDDLSNRIEQMHVHLRAVLNLNTIEQRRQLFSQREAIDSN